MGSDPVVLTNKTQEERMEYRRKRRRTLQNGMVVTHGTVVAVGRFTSDNVRGYYSKHATVDYLSYSGSTAYVNFFWTNLPSQGRESPSRIHGISVSYLRPVSPLELLALQASDDVNEG